MRVSDGGSEGDEDGGAVVVSARSDAMKMMKEQSDTRRYERGSAMVVAELCSEGERVDGGKSETMKGLRVTADDGEVVRRFGVMAVGFRGCLMG